MLFLACTQWSLLLRQGSFALSNTAEMNTKQTIAVIGASGNIGSAISKSLAKGNYRLLLCCRENEKAQELVEEIKVVTTAADVEAIDSLHEASWEADIIILAVPYDSEAAIATQIADVANQKIVISISNPLNGTYNGLITAPNTSAAEELQMLLPHSKVVKAFNTTFAADFSTPVIDGKMADAFIAGNSGEALNATAELVSIAGFNPIIAGELSVSRTLENMQLLLAGLNMKYNYNWLAGWKVLHN